MMSIERWHPFRDFEQVSSDMDRIWAEAFPASRRAVFKIPFVRSTAKPGAPATATGPAIGLPIDLIDKENELVLKADLPGIKKEDIDISLDNDESISIKGKTEEQHKEDDGNFYYSERSVASYSRTITLPCKVDEKRVRAALKNGVLTVHLPKLKESSDQKVKVAIS